MSVTSTWKLIVAFGSEKINADDFRISDVG